MPQVWTKIGNLVTTKSWITSGSAPVTALTVGTLTSIVVPLDSPRKNTSYRAIAQLEGGNTLLNSLEVQGISAKTTTTVTVRLKAVLAVTAGATLTVFAHGEPA